MLRMPLDLFNIAKKDLLEFIRDRTRLVTFIIMPIFMLVMVGFIFPSQSSIKNINIGVANRDGAIGTKLVSVIDHLEITAGTKAFKVKYYSSIPQIKNAIRSQQVNGGIYIPSGLNKNLTSGQQADITIVQDQSNPQVAALATQTLQTVIENFGQSISAPKIGVLLDKTTGKSSNNAIQAILNPIKSTLTGLFAGKTNYFEFVAPGIMAMVVLTAVLTGLGASVSRERETGTLDGILIAPVSRISIILGKATAQSIRGLFQGIIVLLLAVVFFGVTIHGNVLLLLLILLLGIFSFVGLGILISAAAAEQETATQLLFMFQFPMMFLSGVFFPIQQMPAAMQDISKVIPLTYAIEAMRKVMILGGGLAAVRSDILILLAFGAIMLAIAVPVFKRMITQ
jgi:ABC-2 type transport system permease protein